MSGAFERRNLCFYNSPVNFQDEQNGTFDFKHTFAIEIVPICKDNIVVLSKAQAQSFGNLGQFAVCLRVAETICLIDPRTGQSEAHAVLSLST